MVTGTIPPESSLSSSAAMTSCSSILILEAFRAREYISRKEMAEVAIESGECTRFVNGSSAWELTGILSERLVGVNSGG